VKSQSNHKEYRMANQPKSITRPIEEEFAVVVAALLAGRIDGQQAVASLAAIHKREATKESEAAREQAGVVA
jgi:hypothetical protein